VKDREGERNTEIEGGTVRKKENEIGKKSWKAIRDIDWKKARERERKKEVDADGERGKWKKKKRVRER
jgi:hypothetical protein